ncbi:right-handed parallel beta-helix repeat-containing protein [Candidatus Bathyarchaeota archaeon]|nr:right-handed parallel beta-helix repeat-containing protein [Candidatus Bathyarchaeota archaeon]
MYINTKVILLFLLAALFGCTKVILSEFPIAYTSTNTIVIPDQYPTIQSAINAAHEGDLILVRPGRYLECITIDKSLRVIGSGVNLSIIESVGGKHTIEIKANNVVLKGFTITGLEHGPWAGIYIRGSNCIVEENFVTKHYYGIKIYDSSNNILRNNIISNNTYNFGVWGLFLSHFLHNIDFSNYVDGKPILYWINAHDRVVPLEVGYVALINSSKIIVKDLNISKNLTGVIFAYTKDSLIVNVTVSRNERGLYFICSNDNIVAQSNFSDNEWSGVTIISSCNNVFVKNSIARNGHGIRFSHSYSILNILSVNNTIIGNIFSNNKDGLYFEKSHNNMVKGNTMINNTRSGLVLDDSRGNIVKGNIIQNNKYGVWSLASHDSLYQNVFVNNSLQVYVYPFSTTFAIWDDGYPSGGNFWSDYEGLDEKCGPDQDQMGSDGIGDVPYIIDLNNRDRYPLLCPRIENSPPIADFLQVPIEAKVGEDVLIADESYDIDGQILLRIWEIDEEYFWSSKDITIQFQEERIYNVTLIVFDDCGEAAKKSKTIFARRSIPTLLIDAPDSINFEDELEISAILLDEDGNPIVGLPINFYLVNDIEEFIGSATTNLYGAATIAYVLKKVGVFHVKALFLGDQKYASVCISKSLIVRPGHHASHIFWLFATIFIMIFILIKIKTSHRNRHRKK